MAAPKSPKPELVAEVYRKTTALRKEKFGIRVYASNSEVLFWSEKYHNRADALHAAELLCTSKITVVNTT